MPTLSRRDFLQSTVLGGAALVSSLRGAEPGSTLRIATFRADVTPPLGHPLCGGWITPAKEILDPLEAIGYVILGEDKPIVVCALDWTGVLNEANVRWRTALAAAVGTSPDRVALQCVHQHDAPFVCPRAHALTMEHGMDVMNPEFFQTAVSRVAEAAQACLGRARPLTHVARGEAVVEQVASNRRVLFDAEGKVVRMRGSSSVDAELIALPEGLVDPKLRTVAYYSGTEKVVSCHYYATHPMSHYGKGRVGADFVGLARRRRQAEEPGCTHLYFTGAAGNIAAGKYNDGSPEAKVRLTERIYRGITASEQGLAPRPLRRVRWRTTTLVPPADPAFDVARLRATLADTTQTRALRTIAAMRLSWRERVEAKVPIVVSALELDDVSLLHLPAESFLEYQLRAQRMASSRWVATAAYGDGGPWYIPIREAYPQGGYEVSVAFCSPEVDDQLSRAIRDVLT
ncbi:MAG: hypothetical protein JNN01_09895 [Opitutaceae bacterium]|nr:hypothetical protein [Opitutaceae bacterium]